MRVGRTVFAGIVLVLSSGCHQVSKPVSKLDLVDPVTSNQLLKGFWQVESDSWRWTAREFAAALAPPERAEQRGATLYVHLYIPVHQIESLGPMTLSAKTEGRALQSETFSKGGAYIYSSEIPGELLATSILPVEFSFDKAMPAYKSDGRELAAIVSEIELETN